MTVAIQVRDPRTGMTVRDECWADWRRRSFRSRVRACPWCWAFGAIVMVGGHPVGVPCLNCGRVGQ